MMFRDRRSLWSERRITPPRLRTYPRKSLWPRNYSSVPFGTELYHFLKAIQPAQFQKAGYPADWDRRSRGVKSSAGFRCQKCGLGGDRVKLATHHIVPLSKGGSNSSGNLICLCEKCHSMSHSRMRTGNIREDPWEFLFRSLHSIR
jgi:hypothetical protein